MKTLFVKVSVKDGNYVQYTCKSFPKLIKKPGIFDGLTIWQLIKDENFNFSMVEVELKYASFILIYHYPESLHHVCDEQGEAFQQVIKIIEERMKYKISNSRQITTGGIQNSMNPIPNNPLILSTKIVIFKLKLYHICYSFCFTLDAYVLCCMCLFGIT